MTSKWIGGMGPSQPRYLLHLELLWRYSGYLININESPIMMLPISICSTTGGYDDAHISDMRLLFGKRT